jgi:hypothetical protein
MCIHVQTRQIKHTWLHKKKYNIMNCNYDCDESPSLSSNDCLMKEVYKFLKQNENEMEYYLSHPDRNVRLILAKFWLSDHQFLIEIGRYLKIPRDQRLYVICNVLEDEFH